MGLWQVELELVESMDSSMLHRVMPAFKGKMRNNSFIRAAGYVISLGHFNKTAVINQIK